MAGAGKKQRTIVPRYCAGMKKDVVGRVFRYVNHQMTAELDKGRTQRLVTHQKLIAHGNLVART